MQSRVAAGADTPSELPDPSIRSGVRVAEARDRLSDHACWGYASDAERSEVVTAWVSEGIRLGQRALYVAEGTAAELSAELAALPDVAAALASGALAVLPADEMYDLGAPIDAELQLAEYDAAVGRALAAGYSGLRVAADITPLVSDPDRRHSHLRWEQVADRYLTEHPLAPLCLYDTRRLTGVDAIVAIHPRQGPRPHPFTLCAKEPTVAALEGELDALSAEVFAEVLRTLPDSDRVIDASGLSFLDGHTAFLLQDELVRRREAARPVLLSAVPGVVRRLWQVCAFDPALLEPPAA